MAIISLIGGEEPKTTEPNQTDDVVYEIYFGVFFDGTSNNMIQGKIARKIRSNHAKANKENLHKLTSYGWCGDNRHNYEKEVLTEDELKGIEDPISKGSFKDGYNGIVFNDGGFSNIAILFSKYVGISTDTTNTTKKIVYKIYVEGSGANDIKATGTAARGLGFGVSKTGVIALVSKAVSAVESRLTFFKNKSQKVKLYFDIFGFSRGAACARLFSYLVVRGSDEKLDREEEFKKYYCKNLYNKEKKRLSFLDDYYLQTSSNSESSSQTFQRTKEVSFLGIFDTVVSIGILRRKKDTQKKDASNKFFERNNSINPLRASFFFDRDFNENLHDLNVKEYGMSSPQREVPTFHICAMDEFRENFALTDVGKTIPKNSLELFLPGCHSDIGGGYICNNEEKIVLNKYPTFSLEGLPLIKPKKGCARIFVANPQCEDGEHEPIGLSSMRKLGWLPKEEEIAEQSMWKIWAKKTPFFHDKAEVEYSQEKKSVQGKISDKEGNSGKYEWWDKGDKIGWKRIVPSFFSNLPLHLMAERASVITKRKLFIDGGSYNNDSFWPSNYYEIPKGLEDFYSYVKKNVNITTDKGIRKWVFPDGSYCSAKYRKLRLFYLHFTAEQNFGITRIWDVQNATKNGEYYNVISRIIYHGNDDDSGEMHYMFNYIGDVHTDTSMSGSHK